MTDEKKAEGFVGETILTGKIRHPVTFRLHLADKASDSGDFIEIETQDIPEMSLAFGTLVNAPSAAPWAARFLPSGEPKPEPIGGEGEMLTGVPALDGEKKTAVSEARDKMRAATKDEKKGRTDQMIDSEAPASAALLKLYEQRLGEVPPEGITAAQVRAALKAPKGGE